MLGKLLLSLGLSVLLVLMLALTSHSQPYGAHAEAHDSVAVSGSWTGVRWYESDGCYSGVGDPAVSDWTSREQSDVTVSLGTSASDDYASAYSDINVWAPSMQPTIVIHSVGDIVAAPAGGHWASAYSEGGANWLTSGADQTVTVTIDYSYELDLTEANPDMPSAFAKIYVAFWDSIGVLMLTPDTEFVAEGNYLVKTVAIGTAGASTGRVSGTRSWDVTVGNGAFYSFWSMAWAEAWTDYPPTSLMPAQWGGIKALYR